MISHNRAYSIFLALLVSCGNGGSEHQDFSGNLCEKISVPDNSLALQKCDSENRITYAIYKGTDPESPYATEFDEKKLIVAISSSRSNLIAASGFDPKSSELKFSETKLDVIPSPEQISSREVSQTIERNGWIINREDIQYFDPKGPGYIISCATALKDQKNNSVTVAECFPYGQLDGFVELLINLHVQ